MHPEEPTPPPVSILSSWPQPLGPAAGLSTSSGDACSQGGDWEAGAGREREGTKEKQALLHTLDRGQVQNHLSEHSSLAPVFLGNP